MVIFFKTLMNHFRCTPPGDIVCFQETFSSFQETCKPGKMFVEKDIVSWNGFLKTTSCLLKINTCLLITQFSCLLKVRLEKNWDLSWKYEFTVLKYRLETVSWSYPHLSWKYEFTVLKVYLDRIAMCLDNTTNSLEIVSWNSVLNMCLEHVLLTHQHSCSRYSFKTHVQETSSRLNFKT